MSFCDLNSLLQIINSQQKITADGFLGFSERPIDNRPFPFEGNGFSSFQQRLARFDFSLFIEACGVRMTWNLVAGVPDAQPSQLCERHRPH